MNIKDYVNQSKQQKKKDNQTNTHDYYQDDNQSKKLEQDINRYKNLSQNELMAELMKEAGRLKANGSLNESSLNSLKSTLSPMLTEEQRQNLENIINMIK